MIGRRKKKVEPAPEGVVTALRNLVTFYEREIPHMRGIRKCVWEKAITELKKEGKL